MSNQRLVPLNVAALATAPTTGMRAGDLYYNTADSKVYVYSGTAWVASGGSGGGTWGSITGALSSQTDLNSALGLKADLASPALTGAPTSTTPAVSDSTTRIATTAFVNAEILADRPFEGTAANIAMNGAQSVGALGTVARGDHVHPSDTAKVSTSDARLSDTRTPTDASVSTAKIVDGAVTSAKILDGTIVDGDISTIAAIAQSKIASLTTDLAAKAPLASPSLTGIPLSTTAAVDTNTTQIATTAFVVGQAAGTAPVMDGTSAAGTSLRFARSDHVHASDTSRATTASPTFTGTVTTPLTTAGYVKTTSGGVLSSSAAIAQSDVTSLTTDLAAKAPLASPALTGTPTAPTAATGTSTTQIATTAFVSAALSSADDSFLIGISVFT